MFFGCETGGIHGEAAHRGAEGGEVLRGGDELRRVRGLQNGGDVAGEGGEGGDHELRHQHAEEGQRGPAGEGRSREDRGAYAADHRRPAEDAHGPRGVQAAQNGPRLPAERYHQCESRIHLPPPILFSI